MNAEQFIDIVKEDVGEDSIRAVQTILLKPPGMKPSDKDTAMSTWYNSLNDSDRFMVISIIRKSVEMGVFGFLCVLDGVRAIENEPNKGALKLIYEKDQTQVLLNDSNQEYLHDKFNSK